MSNGSLIVFLCSGIKPAVETATGWKSTPLNEEDPIWGAPGGDVRLQATKELFERLPHGLVYVPAGYGRDIQYSGVMPAIADVVCEELERLGIPADCIDADKKPRNTFEQLGCLQAYLRRRTFNGVCVVTNRYHVLRLQTMVTKHFADLVDTLDYLEAESLVMDYVNDDFWRTYIRRSYQSCRMFELVASERRGQQALEQGTYQFS